MCGSDIMFTQKPAEFNAISVHANLSVVVLILVFSVVMSVSLFFPGNDRLLAVVVKILKARIT